MAVPLHSLLHTQRLTRPPFPQTFDGESIDKVEPHTQRAAAVARCGSLSGGGHAGPDDALGHLSEVCNTDRHDTSGQVDQMPWPRLVATATALSHWW